MEKECLKGLNTEQLRAATSINGPMLVIAGAGSGKTRVMVSRAAYMVDSGIPACNILMLTFTNKAAAEMKERVIGMLPADAGKEITACTFHSFCVMLLRRYGEKVGIPAHFTIITGGDETDVINIVKASQGKQKFNGRGFPPSGKIVDIISQSTNKGRPISEIMKTKKFEKYAAFDSEVIEIAKLATAYKKQNSMLNYDDLLVYVNYLLETYPNLCQKVANAYPYIMVDEYQDTNPLQEKILVQLFKCTKNIAVVGDDMQSLYGFRGAEVENIIEFPNRFPGCTEVFLTKNYRSNQEILDLSNKVVQCTTEGFPKELTGTHSSGHKPELISVNNAFEEADDIIERIEDWKSNGVPYNEMCVLFRSSYQSALVEQRLMMNGIPFVKYGGKKFFELEYVKDVLAYLRVAVNQHDEIAWFRILQSHQGIGQIYARNIASECKTNGASQLLSTKYKKKKYKSELELLYRELSSFDGKTLDKILPRAIDFYIETQERNIQNMKTESEAHRTELLEALPAMKETLMMLVLVASGYQSISAFLDDLTLDNTKLTQDENKEGHVVLSTIHSVKGLEFQCVSILDCVDEIFPSTSVEEKGSKEDNEELRCFYVAITRAKENLVMYVPENISKFGRNMHGILSHFLTDTQDEVQCNDRAIFMSPEMYGYGARDGQRMRGPSFVDIYR